MQNVSGFGYKLILKASITFPTGIQITQFADDADPLDFPTQQIADKGMNVNGELVVHSMANPIDFTLNLIPDSRDDRNMAILFDANRPVKGKQIVQDVITVVGIYPDGTTVTLSPGLCMQGSVASGLSSNGKKKSKEYQFAFESVSRA